MNTPPPHLRADRLWRQLAKAQDTAMERDPLPAPRVPGRSRLRKRPMGVALVALGMAAAAVTLLTHRAPPRTSISTSNLPGEVDRLLVADAHSDLPLRFSDGSSLTFRSGASGRMRRLGGDGAEVFLEQGRLEAHVVHTPSTLWLVHAGPYRVRVTGTRFEVVWLAARRRCTVRALPCGDHRDASPVCLWGEGSRGCAPPVELVRAVMKSARSEPMATAAPFKLW